VNILVSAYACEPGKGSEPGVGWNWVKQIARFHEVWVITRAVYQKPIEQWPDPPKNVHWIYFDLPFCQTRHFWKIRLWAEHVYYYLWQVGAYVVAKRLSEQQHFDLIHHVTYAIYWRPSFLALLSTPFIWGPVGVAESTPKTLQQTMSARGRWFERVRTGMQWAAQWDPAVRLTARRAALTLAQTERTQERLRRLGVRDVRLFSHMGADMEPSWVHTVPALQPPIFRVLSIGRLIEWKGFHLALQAFAHFHRVSPTSEYWLIGEGSEQGRLEQLASRLGISAHVHFFGALPHATVVERLTECHVFLHPSFHDAAPSACLEAMAAGLPVICLDIGGPALFVTEDTGVKVAVSTPERVITELSQAIHTFAHDGKRRQQMGLAAHRRIMEHFAWNKKGDSMQALYEEICASGRPGSQAA